jgi:PGF-CTERM protein
MVRWSFLSLLLVAPLLAGCTDFDDARRENYLFVQGIDVSAPEVGSGRIVLLVNTTIDNSEARSGDLRLLVKAFDRDTGLLVRSVETPAEPLGKEETRIVSTRLDLPRASGYRLEVDLYQDERLLRGGNLDVSNLANLEPNRYDSGLRISTIDFEVLDTVGNRTSVRATAYLTNEGGGASRPLSLQLKAREVSTGLLVAQVWAQVGAIRLDATRAFNATLSLPDGYNYDVEAVLWDGEIIVERGVGHVQFAPTTVVNPGQQVVVTRPNLEDFAGGAGDGDGDSGEETPGIGVLAVLAALLLAAVALRRRSTR